MKKGKRQKVVVIPAKSNNFWVSLKEGTKIF